VVKHRERIDEHPAKNRAEVQSSWKKAAGITSFGNKLCNCQRIRKLVISP